MNFNLSRISNYPSISTFRSNGVICILPLFIVLFFAVACSSNATVASVINEDLPIFEANYQEIEPMETLSIPNQGIEILYPEGWEVDHGESLVMFAPRHDELDKFYPLIARNMFFMVYTVDPYLSQTGLGRFDADSAAEHLKEITKITSAETIQPIESISISGRDGARVTEKTESGRIGYYVAVGVDKDVVAIISGNGYEFNMDEVKNISNTIALSVKTTK